MNEHERPPTGGDATIPVEADFFEHLLACLASQKFISEANVDGWTSGSDEVRKVQRETQEAIDAAYHKGWELLQQRGPDRGKNGVEVTE